MAKWVYSFGNGTAEGRAEMRNLLGGKGANLAEMSSLGLPVPPGFTITTEVCNAFYALGRTFPEGLAEQVQAQLPALIGTLLLLLCVMCFSAEAMYLAEGRVQPRLFGTIPDAMWWAITTLTTVGYGDAIPVTPLGKLIAGTTMILGLGLFALPVGIVATGFVNEIRRRADARERVLVTTLTKRSAEELTDYLRDIGFPGQYPFTRGVQPNMYRGRLWTMRQFAGFGTPRETNRRYRRLLEAGGTGLSVAFDLPTLMGRDPDHPLSLGEVGKCGVSIVSLKDMERLFEGIPLNDPKITTSMTINSPAPMIFAMYLVVAEQHGADWSKISGTIQNDILKEFIAQKEYIFPPRPSMRLVTDVFAYCAEHAPRWNTISVSGYHIREAGSTAVQELAFTIADGLAYADAAIARAGLGIDRVEHSEFQNMLGVDRVWVAQPMLDLGDRQPCWPRGEWWCRRWSLARHDTVRPVECSRPIEIFFVACHPVDTREGLEHFAVDLLAIGDDFSKFCVDGGVLPDIVEDSDHTVAPGAWTQPFGKRQQAVFDVFG